ncbi:MAG: hypothetical protein ABSD82_08700 [Solirubrobacteraceae bacterium]
MTKETSSCDRRGWSVRSGRRARRDFDHDYTIRGSERGLRRRLERLAIKVIAADDRRQWLVNPEIRVEQLHLDRLAAGERDDRAGVNLVARIRARSLADRG